MPHIFRLSDLTYIRATIQRNVHYFPLVFQVVPHAPVTVTVAGARKTMLANLSFFARL
jgi:hypothetical protein